MLHQILNPYNLANNLWQGWTMLAATGMFMPIVHVHESPNASRAHFISHRSLLNRRVFEQQEGLTPLTAGVRRKFKLKRSLVPVQNDPCSHPQNNDIFASWKCQRRKADEVIKNEIFQYQITQLEQSTDAADIKKAENIRAGLAKLPSSGKYIFEYEVIAAIEITLGIAFKRWCEESQYESRLEKVAEIIYNNLEKTEVPNCDGINQAQCKKKIKDQIEMVLGCAKGNASEVENTSSVSNKVTTKAPGRGGYAFGHFNIYRYSQDSMNYFSVFAQVIKEEDATKE